MKNNNFLIGLAIGGFAVAIVAFGFYALQNGLITVNLEHKAKQQQQFKKEFSEASFASDLKELEKVQQDYPSIREFFVNLAKQDGGAYAFEVLKRAPLPLNTDLHLLGHAVGDELYKQEGLEGMKYCDHDLRNACSHSIVIGALLATGMDVFDKVNAVCHEAPGGPGAYTMCFHGFGHGVLAYTDYEVPDAVKLCAKVGTDQYNHEEEAQCIGGIVMEMNQGVHDPKTWEEKKDKYLSKDDPLKLCQADYMPEVAKVLCYSYITPYIFDSAGAINGNPRPEIYPKSFSYCDSVKEEQYRLSCYGGFGKEFVVLAQDRDIRKIEDTPNDRLQLAASWCALAPKKEAEKACLNSILDSIYWGGENDSEVSVRFCSILGNADIQSNCFTHLFEITTYYQHDPLIRSKICEQTPEAYKKQCTEAIL